ncbi:MAG: SGNH/GDSL hydrolase family protein [Crocinitomicaceae bacterium]|nr:SGNH/GDSL hydrolase family protein [Crocinitomicaceae bacterium]
MNPEARNQRRKEKRKIWRWRLVIFLAFFLLAEIVLFIMGHRPGVMENQYYQYGAAQYDSVLYADEMGITHHSPEGRFYPNQTVNKEGFMGKIEFTPEAMDSIRSLGKKIVLLVGDSYTSGCCVDDHEKAFASLLAESDEYVVLNFGVGGTDPLHYELVVKKYLPLLKPDLVAVVAYLGNDEMSYDRTAKPFVPVCYPIKNGPWLSSEAPIYMAEEDTYFKNFEEAKKFYYSYYSLRSSESSFFEKLIRPSIILSKLYLYAKVRWHHHNVHEQLFSPPENPPYSYNHLKEIMNFCQTNDTEVMYAAIPSPKNVENNEDVYKKYDYFFNEIPWETPNDLTIEDYDGREDGNHFNNAGHLKFTEFIHPLILQALEQ